MRWRHARLDAANEVGEGGILDQARQLAAMRSGHQLNAPLRYASGRQGLSLRPNLILNRRDCFAGCKADVGNFNCLGLCPCQTLSQAHTVCMPVGFCTTM